MNAVFMGTPEVAVPCLEALAGLASRLRVVTQPDRPVGRSSTPQPSPVKRRALELGLEVVQPERIRGHADFLAWLTAEPLDVAVVVAFGQLLPAAVLTAPRGGCLNVHFSLLPRYRGAAPVQRALLAGETGTGISVMLLDEGLDSGPVLAAEPSAIEPQETAGELLQRLALAAPELLRKTLQEWLAGAITPQPQDATLATLAPRLHKEEGRLRWSQPASELFNVVRGVTPWPGAQAEVAGEWVKVLRCRVGESQGIPGALLDIVDGRGILIGTGDGSLWLSQVQAPGRRPTDGAAYARGRRLTIAGR
ncbi:MAG: methionyl-tRNA formyltransferase [Fimbriimonadaceae bacterium]|nr:methionyl-tRNA formyltransferase [Fimbriimonadaceae bacterium]